MKQNSYRLLGFLLVVVASTVANAETQPYLDQSQPVESRINDLLSRLTIEEKLSLIHGDSKFTTAAIPRLGIPRRWMSDGPMGVREDVGPDTWNSANHTDDFCTAMPCDLLLAATWDPQIAKAYGITIGQEAQARGKQIMLGPAVNIQRTPLCGRNFEYMGEDPWLTSRIAVGYIQGEQSQGVSSCVKHFACNNQETDRGTVDVELDDRTLREIYLPAFKAAVQEAGVWSVMGSYNQIRGEHCCHNDLLLNKILKGEWGFKGLVMSDWSGVHDTRQAVLNGLDLEMGTDKPYADFYLADPFLAGLRSGAFPMSVLDDKARRNLRVMFAAHMFDHDGPAGSLNTPEHQATAKKVAEEGIVLLKNDSAALPLNIKKIKTIAVIGNNAIYKFAHGGGSAELKAFYEVTPLDGIIHRVGDKANVTFSDGYPQPPNWKRHRPTTGSTTKPTFEMQPTTAEFDASAEQMRDRAVIAASQADVVIVVAGLNHSWRFDEEGADRTDIKLPYHQDELIQRVVAANPHTVVVLMGGGAVEMPWVGRVSAIVQAWYPGMEGGNALASILFGDVNPSGKLPCTFPKRLEDSPAHASGDPHVYPGVDGVEQYSEGLLVGYRWFDTKNIEPLFPFGHGLSYSRFEYSSLILDEGSDEKSELTVHADIANVSDRDGSEVVQVYIQPLHPSIFRPLKELKAFARLNVRAGEMGKVSLLLPRSAFAFYDLQKHDWIAESGDYSILVGSSSRDIRLKSNFHLK